MKKRSKSHISVEAATSLLRRLFTAFPDQNQLNLDEIYLAAGRAGMTADANRNWLGGIMPKLKNHGFIETETELIDQRIKVVGIKLTLAGRAALGRHEKPKESTSDKPQETTYQDLAKAVKAFRDDNPDYEVTFSVALKDKPM